MTAANARWETRPKKTQFSERLMFFSVATYMITYRNMLITE